MGTDGPILVGGMGEPQGRSVTDPGLELERVIEAWSETTERWRGGLAGVSDEALWWQPFRKSHSIGGILLHLADVEGQWFEEGLRGTPRSQDELDVVFGGEVRPPHGEWIEPPRWPLDRYFEVLDWIRARSLAAIRQIGDSEHVFDGPDGHTTIAKATRFMAYHEAYHAGQAMLHRLHFDWGGVEPA